MGRKKEYYFRGQHRLTMAIQGEGLKRLFPASSLKLNKDISLVWIGDVQPSPLSDVYTLKIHYNVYERPVVSVIKPELLPRPEARIPHVFPGNELCLFRYKYYEWNSRMMISETILPWASLWLLHYELWHSTGVWCGSKQEHPEGDKPKEPDPPMGNENS